MNSLFSTILFTIIFLSLILILVIMMQNPKGGGLSSSFGGGDTQQLGGVKQTGDFLDKSTWFLAGVLFILILFSNITLNSEKIDSNSIIIDENTQTETENTIENNSEVPLKEEPLAN